MFSYIDPRYLDAVWPEVSPLLESAVAKGDGELDLAQLRLLVQQNVMQLVVWHEDDKTISAGVVEFINYPNYRVAQCSFLSGRYTAESFDALKAWCASKGASKVQCLGSDAIARLYKNYGFEKRYNVLRIDL
jgi:hypothetical protein